MTFPARIAILLSALLMTRLVIPAEAQKRPLDIELVGSDSTAFHVVAAIISGPTEAIVWDAHYHIGDARRLADRIAASGKRLKAIVLSHPDHDHYMGTATLVERFPGTPVYLTPAGLRHYDSTAREVFTQEKQRQPALYPDSLVTPKALPSPEMTIDGVKVEIVSDLVGDIVGPASSALWIPSSRTVLAGDLVFNGVHPWLGGSNAASRAAWRQALKRIAALKPARVIAGHKSRLDAPDDLEQLALMDRYLADFDSLRARSAGPGPLRDAMLARYPSLAVGMLLQYSAMIAFGPPR